MEPAFARPDVTAFLMSNPHNPTGTVPTPEVLAAIAALAAANGVTVISDEIHGPLALPGSDHVPFMSVAPTTQTPSSSSRRRRRGTSLA